MTHINSLARRQQGAQAAVRARRVVGSAEEIGAVVERLKAAGVFVGCSALRFDPTVGSFAVVRYLDRNVAPAARSNLPARREVTARVRPAAQPRPRWVKPAVIAGAVLAVLAACGGLVAWVVAQVAKVTAAGVGTALGALTLILIAVAILMRMANGGSSSGHDGMGFHWTPCKK